jgi:anti-sigma factor (TIGR02949 family)
MTTQIDCEQALRRIFDYIDQELDDERREAMQRHFHACRSCFSRMEFERRLKDRVGELREGEASPELQARIRGLLKNF